MSDSDIPTSTELSAILARDLFAGRITPEDAFRRFPLDDMAAFVAAETHERNLRQPPQQVFVERELLTLRARRQARAIFDAEQRAGQVLQKPELVALADFLAVPDLPVAYRVDKLWPSGGRIVLAAKNKAGKTTLTGNLIRSLVDGDAFLDTFFVEQARRVVLVDDEMSEQQLRSWLRSQGIGNVAAVDVVLLRGRASTFNILDARVRTEWAAAIGAADVLIFDCLRPALDALGLDESHDSGRFLEALDALMAEAGIGELLLVHHMGHEKERSRGDSRLEDWPDAKWKLVRQNPNQDDSPRYFAAYGRDVDQPEVQLAYQPESRRLRVVGGSRAAQQRQDVQEQVLACVAANPGASQSAIVASIHPDKRQSNGRVSNDPHVRAAIDALVASGALRREAGPRNSSLHWVAEEEEDLL